VKYWIIPVALFAFASSAAAKGFSGDTVQLCIKVPATRGPSFTVTLADPGIAVVASPNLSRTERGDVVHLVLARTESARMRSWFGTLRVASQGRKNYDVFLTAKHICALGSPEPQIAASRGAVPHAAAVSKATTPGIPGHSGTNQDLYVDVAVPPVVNAGSVFRSLFTAVNLTDQPIRVRLRLELPEGWTLSPQADFDGEKLIDSFDEIGGELEIEVSPIAKVATGEKVRIVGEVVGDPGHADAVAMVRIAGRGGLRAGQKGLSGYVQAATRGNDLESIDWPGTSANINLSGPVASGTTAALMYQKGLRLDQPPIVTTLAAEFSRLDVTLRSRKWNLYSGNYLLSSGGTLAGPFVRGRGATFKYTGSRLYSEISAGEPASFTGDYRGVLLRGQAQINSASGPMGLVVSNLNDAATGISGRTYDVSGAGAFGRYDRGIVRFGVKAGLMRLGIDSLESSGETVEGDFGLAGKLGNVTGRWRRMPAAVPGTYLPGDEHAGDGTLVLSKALRLTARGYRSSMETMGEPIPYVAKGSSAGINVITPAFRFSLRGNQRQSSYRTSTEQRTIQFTGGTTIGDVSISSFVELGRQTTSAASSKLSNFYLSTRWVQGGSSLYGAVSYYDYGTAPYRVRFDASASLRLSFLELDGGFWATHGPKYGGDPVVWSNVVIAAPAAFSLILGAEYVHGRAPYIRYVDPVTGLPLAPEIAADPTRAPFVGVPVEVPSAATRFTVGLRRRLTVPLSEPAQRE
jgi:hypothetical protein